MRHGYVGPTAAILESGLSVAPGNPVEDEALSDREREFFAGEGWLVPVDDEPGAEQLRSRAGELNIDGRSKMNADELRDAVAKAEADAARAAENGE